MKRCKYHKWILSCIEGELNSFQQQEMDEHLKICNECQREYSETLAMHQLLLKTSVPEPPTAVVSRFNHEFEQRINQRTSGKRRFGIYLRQVMNRKQWVWRIAYAAVLVMIGIGIGRYYLPWTSPDSMDSISSKSYNPILTEYLIDSEILLLTLDNSSGEIRENSIDYDQQLAHSILLKSRRIQTIMEENTDKTFIQFVDQLEMICMELTNRDSKEIHSTFKDLKEIIQETGLIDETRRLQKRFDHSELSDI